ncbi:hypothetical protein M5K25_017379 [Dendrobium thyrsiflorum]|uniref:TFIIF beta subunit HTH domain-containing protein n=1 Tax=Dendrobium thyrsiflorum TaxID=117978 RepID=A0ABD0UUC4_DENTH
MQAGGSRLLAFSVPLLARFFSLGFGCSGAAPGAACWPSVPSWFFFPWLVCSPLLAVRPDFPGCLFRFPWLFVPSLLAALSCSVWLFGCCSGKCALEGKVEHKFDMEPHSENFGEYGKLCRERSNKAMIKTRQIQIIDKDHGVLMRPMPGMVGLVPSGSKDKKKVAPVKGSEVKRTRRDRRELENIIFKLFERQPNWALKQLVIETDQPEQFLKEILNDLCVYNKRGPNQGTHELKPEYKKSAETAAVASEDVGQQEGDSGFAGQQSPSVRRAGTAKVLVGNFWTTRTLAGIFLNSKIWTGISWTVEKFFQWKLWTTVWGFRQQANLFS